MTSKWLYKIKHAFDGGIENYIARFVARGLSQQEGIYYEENFAPTYRNIAIISLISIAATMGWNNH